MVCDYPYNNIPTKYRLGLVPNSSSNRYVFVCPDCNKDLIYHDVYQNTIIGFYDFNGMAVPAYECPFCFSTWWNHSNSESIETQLSLIKFKS